MTIREKLANSSTVGLAHDIALEAVHRQISKTSPVLADRLTGISPEPIALGRRPSFNEGYAAQQEAQARSSDIGRAVRSTRN